MIYQGNRGGMFGGMYGPMQGGPWGGQVASWQPQGGGYRYDAGPQRTGGMFAPTPQMSDEFSARNDVMPTAHPQTDGGQVAQGGSPWGAQGFTGNEWRGGAQQQAAIDPGRNMISQNQIPGFMVNLRAAAPAPTQTLEQFQSTLGNAGAYTSGQVNDMYQKSLQPQNGIYNGNIGPGGTQNPYPNNPNPFPSNWGQQTFGFDPRAIAGKPVTGDLGWYYGRDAIGRTINNQGDAYASFRGPADGFNRSRPWYGR